ncbi:MULTISPECIES: SpoIIE family protein phosphatase [unclassified Streptomyces]|uniref:SpoIIE family protein phosphatase n=1 Tax=unclassified Streptomyces TaxID=2593676 RepID=UPI003863C374
MAVAHHDPFRRLPQGVPEDLGPAVLDALFTQSPVGLQVLDTELRVVRVNTATRAMHGVPAERILGRHFIDALADLSVPEFASLSAPEEVETMVRGVLDSGVAVRDRLVGYRLAADHGRERTYSVSVFRLQDPEGTVLGAALAVVDVTDREEARARLRVRDSVRENVGKTLDVISTCQELVETLVPAFADVAVVEVVDAVVRGEEPPSGPLAQDVPLRRAAFRAREGLDWAQAHPVGDVRSLHSPTPFTQTLADLMPRLVPLGEDSLWLGNDPPRAAAIRASGAHTLLVAPLAWRGTALGLLSLYRTAPSDPYDQGDIGLARDVTAHTALCVDNARRFTREHTIAATVQHHLLAGRSSPQSTLETAHLHVPGTDGGGGWFDTIALSGARTALVLGNVTGHGIQCATTMGQLRTVIHALAALELDPDELLARLNDTAAFLAGERAALPTGDPMYRQPLSASCVYAVYDPLTRTCTFASAGHPTPPVIVHADGTIETADITIGPALGSAEGSPFATTTAELTDGSILALYTPSLHSTDRDGDEGDRALLRDVLTQPHRTLQDLCDDALYARRGSSPGDAVLLLARTHAFPADATATWVLGHELGEAAAARRHTRRKLADWKVDEDTAATTELIVSELVTNALRYGTPPLHLRLIKDRTLTCEVHDASTATPRLRHARTVDEGGRGLFIVAQLARRWGTRYTVDGKTVWTEQALLP